MICIYYVYILVLITRKCRNTKIKNYLFEYYIFFNVQNKCFIFFQLFRQQFFLLFKKTSTKISLSDFDFPTWDTNEKSFENFFYLK